MKDALIASRGTVAMIASAEGLFALRSSIWCYGIKALAVAAGVSLL